MPRKSGTKNTESTSAVTLNEEDLEQATAAGTSPLIKKTLKTEGTTKSSFWGSDFNAIKSDG